jgi:hypothetical protein
MISPGFTAEASLYRASKPYQQGPLDAGGSRSGLVVAQQSPSWCFFGCAIGYHNCWNFCQNLGLSIDCYVHCLDCYNCCRGRCYGYP